MGMTALIHAGRCGAAEACEALLQQGSHSDVQDKSGKTALMAAAEEGHLQVVQVLLAAKANTELKDVLKQDTALILVFPLDPLIASKRNSTRVSLHLFLSHVLGGDLGNLIACALVEGILDFSRFICEPVEPLFSIVTTNACV